MRATCGGARGCARFCWEPGTNASFAGAGQQTPNGYYNIERMLCVITNKSGEVGVCKTCMDARGITPDALAEGAKRRTLEDLTDWTVWADKTLVL